MPVDSLLAYENDPNRAADQLVPVDDLLGPLVRKKFFDLAFFVLEVHAGLPTFEDIDLVTT